MRPLTVFVAHPSMLLTDHVPHGDGLAAHAIVTGLAARGHRVHVAAQWVALRAPLPAGVVLHHLGLRGRTYPTARLGFARAMRRCLLAVRRTERVDLVHQLNPVDTGLSLAVADQRLPVVLGPYVPGWAAEHDDAPRPAAPGLGPLRAPGLGGARRVLRAAQQSRARVLLLSTPAAAGCVARPGRPGLVRVLPFGVDAGAFTPPAAEPAGEDVVFLGALQRRKGVLVLVEAFARVHAERPAARLLVAGGGFSADAVRAAVAASPARPAITLLGPVARERAAALLRDAAVVCVPSHAEPFGLAALEAMAAGRPVVATAAGGLAHLVDDLGAVRIPPGEPDALAAAVTGLLADPGRRAAMGAHNRARVERELTWERVVERLERIYGEALPG